MKRIILWGSTILTMIVYILGGYLEKRANILASTTYNLNRYLCSVVIIYLIIGLVIGWNIWLMNKNTAKLLDVLGAVLLNVIFVVLYYFRLHIYFTFSNWLVYPLVLTGIYLAIFITKLKEYLFITKLKKC